MKKLILFISCFSIIFVFLSLTPIQENQVQKRISRFNQAIIPAETLIFNKNQSSNGYHNVNNLDTNFNIYNTPNDYNPQNVNQRENVLVILDCSYSMDDEVRGKRKIDIARNVINDVLGELPKNMNMGFRVYGQEDGGLFGMRT